MSRLVPTRITDKNGRDTIVYRNLDEPTKQNISRLINVIESNPGFSVETYEDSRSLVRNLFGTDATQNLDEVKDLIQQADREVSSVNQAMFVALALEKYPGVERIDYRVDRDLEDGGHITHFTGVVHEGKEYRDGELHKLGDWIYNLETDFISGSYSFLDSHPELGDAHLDITADNMGFYESDNEILREQFPDPLGDLHSVSAFRDALQAHYSRGHVALMGREMRDLERNITGIEYYADNAEEGSGYSFNLISVLTTEGETPIIDHEGADEIEDIFLAHIYDAEPSPLKGLQTLELNL